MSLPAFIDVDVTDQMLELRSHLKSVGADISEKNIDKGGLKDLHQIVKACSIYWKVLNDEEIETAFNGIISLIIYFPHDDTSKIVSQFCEIVGDVDEESDVRGSLRIQLLHNLFHCIKDDSPIRYEIYSAMVKVAKHFGLSNLIVTNLSTLNKWFTDWNLTQQEKQRVLRSLYDALNKSKNSEAASKVMVELLATYTSDNASQARNEANRCIVTCLSDPNTYLLDHLLQLKPVKFLEGELIHNLLSIFVSGTLSEYLEFYKNNSDTISDLGLSHEENVRKMRLLTFVQMAEYQSELDFDSLCENLQLADNEVEEFVINAICTKIVRAKIDQVNRRVLVDHAVNRTFGRQQWQQLRQHLNQWQCSLDSVQANFKSLARMKTEQFI